MQSWRLIIDPRRSAAFNMAADAWLWQQAETTDVAPVVRLYQWHEPSITIGYHQKPHAALRLDKLGETPVARRITGGRALLHDDGEITYAVAGNFTANPELGDDLWKSYMAISQAIIEFYRLLGWKAEMSLRRDIEPVLTGSSLQKGCFASVSRHELLVRGEKMAASSQRRGRHALVQHGAVRFSPLSPHPAIEIPGYGRTDGQALSKHYDRAEFNRLFAEAIASAFQAVVREQALARQELNEIEKMVDRHKIIVER